MTSGLTCSNCGGPMTRTGSETRLTCPHCAQVMDVPLPTPAVSRPHDEDRRREVLVIREAVVREPPIVIVRNGPTVVRRRSAFAPFVTSLVFVLLAVAVSTFVHLRAARLATEAPAAAERAAERAEKAVEKVERKASGHH